MKVDAYDRIAAEGAVAAWEGRVAPDPVWMAGEDVQHVSWAAEVGSRLSGTGTVAVVVVGMVLAVACAALLLHLSQPAGGLEDDC